MCQSKSCQLHCTLHDCRDNLQPTTTTTHTHPFKGPFSGTTRVSRYQRGKTNLDFTEARYSEWQWHQLGRMQVCISLQTDNHASTPPRSVLQAICPSCRPTNSVKALKAQPTTNSEQIEVMALEGYSRPTCKQLCAQPRRAPPSQV